MLSNLKLLLPLGFLTVSLAADIFTYKIRDFQGSMLDLTNACPDSLTPVQSSKKTTEKSQNASRSPSSTTSSFIFDSICAS
jgi:hypothetical protein